MDRKKNTYLAVITIITVAAIVVGSLYHIGSAIYDFGSFLGRNIGHGSEETSGRQIDFSETYADVREIYIECAMAKVDIEAGDVCEVSYTGISNLKPEVSTDSDGRLHIRQKRDMDIRPLKKSKSELTIVVPQDGVKHLDIELAMGDLNIDGVAADKAVFEVAAGDVYGEDIVIDDIDLEAAMGNINLDDTYFSDLSAEAAMGNITIGCKKPLSCYDIDAEASLGNIDIDGKKISGSKSIVQSASGDRIGSIKLNCAMGNIILD